MHKIWKLIRLETILLAVGGGALIGILRGTSAYEYSRGYRNANPNIPLELLSVTFVGIICVILAITGVASFIQAARRIGWGTAGCRIGLYLVAAVIIC